jgi:hypothetical protein
VPTLRQGSSPGESCSLREFWGRRYNACISEHCRASIFVPLLRAGWGPAAASLAVFAYTGALHAVPSRLGGISSPQAGALFLFFALHWALCTAEAALHPRGAGAGVGAGAGGGRRRGERASGYSLAANVRTWLMFIAVYPLFGCGARRREKSPACAVRARPGFGQVGGRDRAWARRAQVAVRETDGALQPARHGRAHPAAAGLGARAAWRRVGT